MLAIIAVFMGGLMVMLGSAYVIYKIDWKAMGVFAVLLAATLVATGSPMGLPMLAAPMLLGGIGGYSYKARKSFQFFIITASFSLAAVYAGTFFFMLVFQNMDYIGMVRDTMSQFAAVSGMPEDFKTQMLREFDESRFEIIARIPISSLVSSMAMSGLGFIIIKKFLSRFNLPGGGSGLESFRLNDYFIFVLIAGFAVFLLVDNRDYPVVKNAGLNVLLSAALLYFVQALAVIKSLLIRRGLPGYILPLALVLGLGLAMFMFVLLAGFGALDVWADFRKMMNRGDSDKGI